MIEFSNVCAVSVAHDLHEQHDETQNMLNQPIYVMKIFSTPHELIFFERESKANILMKTGDANIVKSEYIGFV
jgi:hypothetical protein